MPQPLPPQPPAATALEATLSRPRPERIREYKYRFAQSVVFGLPVLALQEFGPSLGGPEAGRWVAVLQALLAGWVVYVAAAGMLFESALLLIRRRFSPDLPAAAVAVGAYLIGLSRALGLVLGSAGSTPSFHWAVVILAAWTGLRWLTLAKTSTPDAKVGRAANPVSSNQSIGG